MVPATWNSARSAGAGYIAAISRGDLTAKILANYRICSRHFISGKPSALEDESNPDWLPSLNLGHSKVSESRVRIGEERWSRRKARENAQNVKVATATAMFTASLSTDDAIEGLLALSSPCVSVTRCSNESDEVYTSVLINPVSDASVQTNIPSCSDTSVETDLSSRFIFSYGKFDVQQILYCIQ